MRPNDDLCDACGYHLVLKKVIDISGMPKRQRSSGLERMLEEQVDESTSTGNALLWIKGAAIAFGVLVCWLCLGSLWWLGVLVIAGGSLWYWHQSQQHQQSASSEASGDPLVRLVWNSALGLQRIAGWRRLAFPFAKCHTLILRDPEFDDRDLAEFDGLADVEALDLEGTAITDRVVPTLQQIPRLRFVVLRGTRCTPAGVRELESAKPGTMVWL